MKIDPKTLKGLKLYNSLLNEQNGHIRERLALRDRVMANSLSSISGPGFGQVNGQYAQTPITSFNPMLQNNIYAPLTIDWTILMYAYKTHGLIQTLCDMPVLDALRGSITIRSKELDDDEIGLLEDKFNSKEILDTIIEAQIWTRLFGGGALIISTDRPSEEPLDLKQLARDKELQLYACNRWELMAPWRIAPQYNVYGKTVDASRVITMSGKAAPYLIRWQLAGWGMSELERVIEDFNTYIRVKNVIYELLYEAKVDVYKFAHFADQILAPEAEQQVNKRMQLMNASKNYNSALLMDKEDDFDQKQITFSGLAEIYRESRIELAASLRMPMSKLFGIPSTGFSSGEDDRENYHEMVESEVRRPLRPVIRQILDYLCVALLGDTYDLDFDYKPLRLLGTKEQEEVDTSKFNRMMMLHDKGLITPEELGEMLAKAKLVDSDISLVSNPDVLQLDRIEEQDGEGLEGDKKPGKEKTEQQ